MGGSWPFAPKRASWTDELPPLGPSRSSVAGSAEPRSESSSAAPTVSPPPASTASAARALEIGLQRVQVLAWRDFEDPEAGGSELHAHRMATAWARAGLDISMRTSAAPGQKSISTRDGYQVIRKSGRYGVFPRSALSGMVGRRGRPDGLIEIWNGMPFFTPLWARCPRIVFLHHVHAAMWRMVLTPRLAAPGRGRRAPPGAAAVPPQPGAHPFHRRRATRSCRCSGSTRPG